MNKEKLKKLISGLWSVSWEPNFSYWDEVHSKLYKILDDKTFDKFENGVETKDLHELLRTSIVYAPTKEGHSYWKTVEDKLRVLTGKRLENSLKSVTNNKTEVIPMELKNVKASNLKEANKQFKEENMNAEILFAKKELRQATDKINEYDAQIKSYEDLKTPYLEILAKFK